MLETDTTRPVRTISLVRMSLGECLYSSPLVDKNTTYHFKRPSQKSVEEPEEMRKEDEGPSTMSVDQIGLGQFVRRLIQ